MITNSNNYTIKPWKQVIGNRSTEFVNGNNLNTTENSFKIEKTDFYYNNDSNTNSEIPENCAVNLVNGNEKECTKKNNTLDRSNEHIGITESVVFERIFPTAVKKLWSQSVEPCGNNNFDKPKPSMNHRHHLDKRISIEFGDAFLSHDLAREERQKSEPKLVKNDNVSDSPELPIARNKWGVKLRHVKRDDLDDRKYKFDSTTSVQKKNIKLTEIAEPMSFIKDDLYNNHNQLTESSNINKDFSDSCIVDVSKLNEQAADEVKNLSVNERRKTFERNVKTSSTTEQNKYNTFQSRLSPKRKTSFHGAPTAFFYQGPTADDTNLPLEIQNVRSPTERKIPISLEDLLKQDEMKLTVDVLDKPTSPGIKSPSEHLDMNDNITSPVKLNGQTIHDDNAKVFEFSRVDDAVSTITQEHKPREAVAKKESVTVEPNSDATPISNANLHQKKPKIVRRILATPVNVGVNQNLVETNTKRSHLQSDVRHLSNSLEVSPKLENSEKKIFSPTVNEDVNQNSAGTKANRSGLQSDVLPSSELSEASIITKKQEKQKKYEVDPSEKITPEINNLPTASPTMNGSLGIRYNKLGQVILDTVKPENLKSDSFKNSLPASDSVKEVTHQKELKSEGKIIGKINSNKLNKKQEKIYDVSISSNVTEHRNSNETVKRPNNLKMPSSADSHTSSQKPSSQTLPSLSQQKRRVGKLIIMTGEQRDEQLRNRNKNVNTETSAGGVRQIALKKEIVDSSANPKQQNPMNGFSLTFVSNELDDVDDDPNAQPPVVPKVVFNEPVRNIKSILSPGVNKKKNKKKARVSFCTKLATLHSYPSEASFYEDSKASYSVTNVSGLSTYQPSSVNEDIGSVIQRERDRIQYTGPSVQSKLQQPNVNISYSTEGDHFNTHYSQEGGQALLF